ncbi:MAG: hypothetical protein MPN21_14315 [Thermoanaerobaculia bacterium]|nr:hypothetical protein [Thermoanaerobaculia bacterium]
MEPISPIARSRLDAVVVGLLGPVVGSSMAQAAVEGHCRILEIDGSEISAEKIEMLIDRLRQGMTIFVGPEKAQELATALRDELSLGPPPNPAT